MKLVLVSAILASMSFAFVSPTASNKSNPLQDKKKWVAPEASKKVKNPVACDAESLSNGKELYNKHCKSCHGATGKGDGPKSAELETETGDFKKMAAQTDGELFYKVKEGKDDMPSFKKKISDDEEIWNIVNYVNTLKKK